MTKDKSKSKGGDTYERTGQAGTFGVLRRIQEARRGRPAAGNGADGRIRRGKGSRRKEAGTGGRVNGEENTSRFDGK